MFNEKSKIEILAPAGSEEQLIAAVNNGCDSVYLGLGNFNARMKAPNFTEENIKGWIDYCHIFGVKVYVAINTSLKNSEFAEAVRLLKEVYDKNADGVILTDLALIEIAAQLPKPFEVVASTQLNVHDEFGARFVKKLGASTVVCARESRIEQIKEIAATGITTECFIHGATCVCQSGQCLFSAMVGGNSGNRGLCAQPCRKLYSINDSPMKYFLSARDLCGLNIAKKLYDAGVTVYKIEGRNRRAEYAGITSKVYKNLFENDFKFEEEDVNNLAEMYNRDMSSLGYTNGSKMGIISPNSQNHSGVAVGTVSGNGVAATKEIFKGDGLKIFDNGKEACGGIATGCGNRFVTAEFGGAVKDGMEVRRTTSVKLCEEIKNERRKINICLTFEAYEGKTAKLTASSGKSFVTVESDFITQKAQKTPTTREEILQQLQKTGNSHNTICDIDIKIGNIFLAKSQINAMRRKVLEALDKKIAEDYNSKFSDRAQTNIANFEKIINAESVCNCRKSTANTLAVVCYTSDQLKSVPGDVGYKIYKPRFIDENSLLLAKESDAFVDIPSFADGKYMFNLLRLTGAGVVCHNVGHVQIARELGLKYIAGSGLNIYNDYIARQFDDAETFVYSPELSLKEISQFVNGRGLIFVDGKITLMKFVHCPYAVAFSCGCDKCKADEKLVYTDELGNKFEINRRRDKFCTFELVNGNKLSVVSKLKKGGRFLVDYDEKIVSHYLELNNGGKTEYVEIAPHTKGRLFDGVK